MCTLIDAVCLIVWVGDGDVDIAIVLYAVGTQRVSPYGQL